MVVNTHGRENMASVSPFNGDTQSHHTNAKKNCNETLPTYCEMPQTCHTGKEAATSTITKPRGKHVLPDLEAHEMPNFAPYPRQERSAQRLLSASVNSGVGPDDEIAEEQSYADKRFELHKCERHD